MDDEYKKVQAEIVNGIDQQVNFDTTKSRFQRGESFQDNCVKRFPKINMLELNKLERLHTNDIGVLVCRIQWDADT